LPLALVRMIDRIEHLRDTNRERDKHAGDNGSDYDSCRRGQALLYQGVHRLISI
jgi:hypothetical protein